MKARLGALVAAAALLLAGCGGADEPPAPAITVLAAASLTEAFEAIGEDFEETHPGATVTFSFGSSSTLATQISEGAPADVFASANESTMQSITDAGLNDEPLIFATNTLQIAVPPGNPGMISGLADFADESKKVALCAPQVPCGSAAEQVFEKTDLTPKPDTLEQDVKATLQKVQLNEVDAALVYRTDVISAGDKVEGIDFDEAVEVINNYPICTVKESKNAELAAAFVDHVLSDEGQKVLSDVGLGAP